MSEYPIEGLMNTAMNSIKEMIDVNTIIGDPIETNSNVVVIPVSKVNFGFAAGGSEFTTKLLNEQMNKCQNENDLVKSNKLPFGGGSGAGVSINPVAFIVIQPTGVKLLPIEHSSALDKLLDLVPDLVDKTISVIEKQTKKIEDNTQNFQYKYASNSSDSNMGNSKNEDSKKSSKNTQNSPSNIINNQQNKTDSEGNPYDIEYDETDM